VTLRAAAPADAPHVAALLDAISREAFGTADADETEVRRWLTLPGIAAFVAERDGLVGYADVRADGDGARFPLDVRVALDADVVVDDLLDAIEGWCRQRSKPGALARAFPPERDAPLRAALERRGFLPVRHSFQMLIELSAEPEPPRWPEGISVRTYDPTNDEEAVYACTQDAFADHWDFQPTSLERWRLFHAESERFDPDLWWLAAAGDELVGICLDDWHWSGDPTFGWVSTLAVRRPWRRQGLGLALLRNALCDFHRRGATRVGLGVDAENTTGAVRLYERAGMHVARRSDTYEKELTP
jgi:mycothiol synthase